MGRPPKPEGRKYVLQAFRIDPDLLAAFRAKVPADRRSAFVRAALRERLGLAKSEE